MKPFAESCEENKQPILQILQQEMTDSQRVLEIGTGTGQHAVFFAEQLPHLQWICSDLPENHAGIRLWLDEAGLRNTEGPLSIDARQTWPDIGFDSVFSANAIHIMSWQAVEGMVRNIGRLLPDGGKIYLYGPFMYEGQHTAESNARFDVWLKARDPQSGVRDVSDLGTLMDKENITLVRDYEMPVNNRILVWQKSL
jgi:cyclopropane fatty-acyl-phospholipid synthase-like methyltransferase